MLASLASCTFVVVLILLSTLVCSSHSPAIMRRMQPAARSHIEVDARGTMAASSLSIDESDDTFPAPRLLVTTAYWKIKSKLGEPSESDAWYNGCMWDLMSLRAPLVTYGDAYGLNEMRAARDKAGMAAALGEVEANISELDPCAGSRDDLWGHPEKYTNSDDVPSVDLGCLWDSKPGMLAQSARDHPDYEWYAWLDVCLGHGVIPWNHGDHPWPNPEKLEALRNDRIAVSFSTEDNCESCREGWAYCHCLAGTAFVVPRSLVGWLAESFSQKVRDCLQAFSEKEVGAYVCLSDQVILTKLYLESPDAFFVGSSGYGAVAVKQLT